jgi:hypothetical protein
MTHESRSFKLLISKVMVFYGSKDELRTRLQPFVWPLGSKFLVLGLPWRPHAAKDLLVKNIFNNNNNKKNKNILKGPAAPYADNVIF